MDAFLAQAKTLVKTTDEAGRKKILDTLREVSYLLESPQDSAQRIMYLVRSFFPSPNLLC
jgi:demethylsterigmatocystin 6-O-methyltransferase